VSHFVFAFDDVPWEVAAPGLRLKQTSRLGVRIRLAEFSSEYDRTAWCEVGHAGYVIEGQLTFRYDTTSVSVLAGSAFFIEHGPRSRHQTHIAPNGSALVFLFEDHGERP